MYLCSLTWPGHQYTRVCGYGKKRQEIKDRSRIYLYLVNIWLRFRGIYNDYNFKKEISNFSANHLISDKTFIFPVAQSVKLSSLLSWHQTCIVHYIDRSDNKATFARAKFLCHISHALLSLLPDFCGILTVNLYSRTDTYRLNTLF